VLLFCFFFLGRGRRHLFDFVMLESFSLCLGPFCIVNRKWTLCIGL